MADGSNIAGKPRTVGSEFVRRAKFWNLELKPKDPRARKPVRTVKWWSVWRWRIWNAKPLTLKRSPIPSLGGLMKVDDRSWDMMQAWANRLAVGAVAANLIACAVYAFVVATQSELPITRHWDATIPLWDGWTFHIGAVARWAVVALFAVVALLVAVVMQFGSDFALPFASGLASERLRMVPSALFVLILPICLMTTAAMKIDIYTGWGRERIAESTERATLSAADQAIIDRYAANVPPPVEASDAKIEIAQTEIDRLTPIRTEAAATRTREENDPTKPGRGSAWDRLNAQVADLDGQIKAQTDILAVARTERAQRIEYDGAMQRRKETVRDTTESERQLLYDNNFVVWLRALGMSAISPMFVLASFMIRGARADIAKRKEATLKANRTKAENANTWDTEYQEAAPINAPMLGDGPLVEGGAPADMHKIRPSNQHPDKAGDDYGAGANGYVDDEMTEGDDDVARDQQ